MDGPSCSGPPTVVHSNPVLAKILKPVHPDECYDPEELELGMQVEAEHSPDEETQKIIVKNHLDEFMTQPGEYTGYYEMLLEVEDILRGDQEESTE